MHYVKQSGCNCWENGKITARSLNRRHWIFGFTDKNMDKLTKNKGTSKNFGAKRMLLCRKRKK